MPLIACYIDIFSHSKYIDDSKCTRTKIDFFFFFHSKESPGGGGSK